MEHLKLAKQTQHQIKEEIKEEPKIKEPKNKEPKTYYENPIIQTGRGGYNNIKTVLIGPFANPSEEKSIIKQIDKMVDEQTFDYIMKITRIYTQNIITRSEAFELLAGVQVD